LAIIFVTAYNHYATEAFGLSAGDYILKPIRLDRLRAACERVEAAFRPAAYSAAISIRVSSELTFVLPDGKVERPQWRTAKVKELFLYLVHHKGKSVRKSELAELLWPEASSDKSHSRLYTAIYHLRKALRPYTDSLAIESMDEGYALTLKNASVDLADWEEQINQLSPLQAGNMANVETTMALYSGPYLDKYDYLWAVNERYRLEQLWLDHASAIADFYQAEDQQQLAVNWYAKIFDIRPDFELAVLPFLKGLDRLGNHSLITVHYRQYKETMKELNLDIQPDIAAWYSKWIRRLPLKP